MPLARLGGIFGILAAACLVAGMFIGTDTPDGDASESEWVDFIEDNATMLLARAYVMVAGSLSLVALYAFGIRPRLGEVEPMDRSLAHLGAGATVLATASFTTGGLIAAAVGAANEFNDVPINGNLAATLDNFSYGFVLVSGALSMAVVMAVVAIQTQRRRLFPHWILWVSAVAILGMLASIIFIPFVLLPIWLIAVSVALFLVKAGETRTVTAA